MDNKLVWVKDGTKELDIVFATGANNARQITNAPYLILLDLRFKVDGMEVLRRIKDDERAKTFPVVVPIPSNEDRDVVEKLPTWR